MRSPLPLLVLVTLLAAAPTALAQGGDGWPPPRAPLSEALADCRTEKPKDLFLVTRVVDGDTIWIERDGEREKLRLLGVDTEEKWIGGNDLSASKPSTRFGEQSTGWAQGFFLPRTPDEGPARVGLRFPGGIEARDPYGRLLCHVVTADGIDFNLLLVRLGWSPYFDKYGSSRIAHDEFVAAQSAARAEKRGVWDPRTNEGGKRRDYERLLPWWKARAQAVDAFREKAAREPLRYVAADDPDGLQRALDAGGKDVTILALVDRFFDEDDGSWTVLMRSGDARRSVRVRVPSSLRAATEALDLPGTGADFRQNYLLVTGDLVRGKRGFDLAGVEPEDWRPAGPEPEGR
ncbi:MAG: thermonuclease family protein [Planctomycetota bacterium]